MRRNLCALLAAATFVALGAPRCVAGQTGIEGRAASITVGGDLQGQFQATSVDAADNDFLVRRARLHVALELDDFLSGEILTDFAGGGATLLDAYVRMAFSEGLNVSAGQMKRSFDLFELVTSSDLSVIERDGRVAGYAACTGVGSVCSYSRLTEELDYAGRDAGIGVDGSSGSLGYRVTVTNGRGVGVRDENDGKSIAGRLSLETAENVTVSGNLSMHDYLDPFDETQRAFAWGADVQLGTWRDGLLVQASLVGGDNWQSLGLANDPARFIAFQGVVSYYSPIDRDRFRAVEPLARVSVADPDGDVAADGGTLITPGVMFYMTGRNKIGVNLDYYVPQTGDSVYSLKVQTFLYF